MGADQSASKDILKDAAFRGKWYHPKKTGVADLKYGTAGFRSNASNLDACLYRMGLLAVIRSKQTKMASGMMITASHNPVQDNGVKLVDPSGDMLIESFEKIATALCNVSDDQLIDCLTKIIQDEKIDVNQPATVFLGRDTRPSSAELALSALEGVSSLHATVRYAGACTTPQLHFLVRCYNVPGYGLAENHGYVDKLSSAWNAFIALGTPVGGSQYTPHLTVDGANGVGAPTIRLFEGKLNELQMEFINTGKGVLNSGCGADFVKTKQTIPDNASKDGRYAAFDGDADRLIYFFVKNGKFNLLDGDRIATLLAKFLGEQLQIAGLLQDLNVGLVQTGYANGASVKYGSKMLNRPAIIAKTGVKFCHAAAKHLDVGLYFEANGHGTIIFSQKYVNSINTCIKSEDATKVKACEYLLAFRDLINEAVGDAISDMLATEAVLRYYGWSCDEWLAEYADLPNKLEKVVVKDRYVVETLENDETTCVKPAGLQDEINIAMKAVGEGRSFVRPSGTEDVIRVYAEASTPAECEKLMKTVVGLVNKYCN